MSRAPLFADAINTLTQLFYAGAAWLLLAAMFATIALYAVTVVVWTVCRAVWKAARWRPSGPSWRRGRLRARIHAARATRAPRRRTEPQGYQEAA
ncbi:hypothetical protein AB0M11_26440 [Streptomyces sp. NPDC051987]|uniref:hypothetical protein n=1 Tax=Streptomyces sp. NPDC051987 TaxID=3155808 RepID=UPI0034164FF9